MTEPDARQRLAPLTASLPMYDLPELREANNALWAGIAERLRALGVPAPETLSRDLPSLEEAWRDPRLLLSQACGYPLMTALKDEVAVVATPTYRAPGCDGPFHRSAVIVRAGCAAETLADLSGRRCAVNGADSNTGMNLLRVEVSIVAEGRPFFSEVVQTGSHLASLERVAAGQADIAAIDAVTLAQLQRHRPHLTKGVRLLFWTVRTPGLPLITSRSRGGWMRIALQRALADVAADPAFREVRDELMLTGFASLRRTEYRSILHLARIAAHGGYPQLC